MSIKFKVEVDPPLDHITLPFRRFRATALDNQLEALSITIYHKIRDEAPKRSGNLIRSIQRKRRGRFDYDIFVDSRMKGGKYEHFVRLGTAPHLILPKKKKALFWPGLPHPVRMANHPGTKPDPYWDRGLDNAQSDINRAEELIGSQIEKELTQ